MTTDGPRRLETAPGGSGPHMTKKEFVVFCTMSGEHTYYYCPSHGPNYELCRCKVPLPFGSMMYWNGKVSRWTGNVWED